MIRRTRRRHPDGRPGRIDLHRRGLLRRAAVRGVLDLASDDRAGGIGADCLRCAVSVDRLGVGRVVAPREAHRLRIPGVAGHGRRALRRRVAGVVQLRGPRGRRGRQQDAQRQREHQRRPSHADRIRDAGCDARVVACRNDALAPTSSSSPRLASTSAGASSSPSGALAAGWRRSRTRRRHHGQRERGHGTRPALLPGPSGSRHVATARRPLACRGCACGSPRGLAGRRGRRRRRALLNGRRPCRRRRLLLDHGSCSGAGAPPATAGSGRRCGAGSGAGSGAAAAEAGTTKSAPTTSAAAASARTEQVKARAGAGSCCAVAGEMSGDPHYAKEPRTVKPWLNRCQRAVSEVAESNSAPFSASNTCLIRG